MAANNFDPPKPNYYQLLGVPINASTKEIEKAFKREALRQHPDKAGDQNTEAFQVLLKAKDTLMNKIERAKYDEDCEDLEFEAAGSLTHGTLLSDQFLSKFMEWKDFFIVIPRSSLGQFPQALQNMLLQFSDNFLKEQLARTEHLALQDVASNTVTTSQTKRKTKTASSPLQDILQTTSLAGSHVKVDVPQMQSNLARIYKHAISCWNESDENIDLVPIVNFSECPTHDIRYLVGFFSTDSLVDIQSMNRSQLLGRLFRFVPCKPADFLLGVSNDTSNSKPTHCVKCKRKFSIVVRSKQTCVQCKNLFCKQCPLNNMRMSGFGISKEQLICDSCFEQCYQQHAKEWIEQGVEFIKAGTLADLKTALACITLALSLNVENRYLAVVGRELLQQGLPELALPMVLAAQQQAVAGIDKIKSNNLLSSVLKGLAGKFDDWDMKWPLLVAAKEACLHANMEVDLLDDSSLETPNLRSAIEELNEALSLQHRMKEHEQELSMGKQVQKLETLWISRDLQSIMEILKQSKTPEDDSLVQHNLTLTALENFLRTKEPYLQKMLPADRYSLIFLRGILKLHHQRFTEGIADIEHVAWCAMSFDLLRAEAIDILLWLLSHKPSLFSLRNVHSTLTTNQHRLLKHLRARDEFSSCLPRDLHLLIPDDKELTPPFSQNWPELTVCGLNLRAHHKCEQAFDRQLKEGKWGYRDLGFTYINYVQGCNHPAECAVSLLHASMWFLKDIQTKPQMEKSEKFALKKLILHCLEIAYGIAHMSLHPGMQLYVSSIAVKTAFEALSFSENLALPEDTKLVSSLLTAITYNSRFMPFWKFPSVPVSEAVLLNIISGKLHSQYLLQLKQMNPEQRPVTEPELRYQLYENDLRCVHSHEDPKTAHTQAMVELLREKGWTMADVVDLMTSPLSPRDGHGWLIPQPKLGIHQEYAEIKGMVLDLHPQHPSVKLVVIPAEHSRGRLGTFSHTDFQDVISMVLDEECTGALFFSLDQPDNNKRFHPFQEFRYSSETLQKTNLLHTLFETDYLLKSFSVGTEVSAKPPFKQRLNKRGLTQKLPQHLQQKLRPVSERGQTGNRAHRFWIQADKIVYDEKQTGSTLEIRLGNMDMVVRSHPLLPGKDGKLEDSEKDEDPDSPEAKFAADMTESYNELGLHFPMFSRLRELAKLQVLGLFLRGILKNMKDKSEGKDITVSDELLREIQHDALQSIKTQLGNNLDSIGAEIGIWPVASDSTTISTEVRRVLSELPRHVYASYSDIEPHVKSALETKDQNVLSQVVEGLLQAGTGNLSRNVLTTYVRHWLSSRTDRTKNELVNYVSSAVPLPDRNTIRRQLVSMFQEQYDAFKKQLQYLRSPHTRREQNPCKWVPAALRREQDDEHISLCYGGVLIAPDITQGRVPLFPRHSQCVPVKPSTHQQPSRSAFRLLPPLYSHTSTRRQSSSVHVSLPIPRSVPVGDSRVPSNGGSGCPPGGSSPSPPSSSSSSPSSSRSNSRCDNPSEEIPEKNKWDFAESDKPQSNWMTIGKHLLLLLQNLYGDATGEGGTQSDDSSGGRRHRRKQIWSMLSAIALGSFCIQRLLERFKDKNFDAKSAFEEVAKDTNINPPCRDKKCPSCSHTREGIGSIHPITSFIGGDGRSYNVVGDTPPTSRYTTYMLQCKVTGKIYVGMTTREAIVRLKEHFRDIAKGRKTNAAHFNEYGCFGQFEEHMNISVVGSISEEKLEPYNKNQRKQIMEFVEGNICELIGRGQLITKRFSSKKVFNFKLPDDIWRVGDNGNVYIDGKLELSL